MLSLMTHNTTVYKTDETQKNAEGYVGSHFQGSSGYFPVFCTVFRLLLILPIKISMGIVKHSRTRVTARFGPIFKGWVATCMHE